MPKHTIYFSLPEEQQELNITVKAMDYKLALDEVVELLRNKIKYNRHEVVEGREITLDLDTLAWLRQEVCNIKNDRNLEG